MIFEVCAYLDNKDLLIETIGEEKIDLIISEIDLNGSSAQDILRILKKDKIDIPVVIFTSLLNEIKSLGVFKVKINLHSEVQVEIKIKVISEDNIN